MFKKKRSINLSYERQGFIFFTCLTYRMQPLNIQKRIENLCVEVAGEDFQALFALLTCEYKTAERIAADYEWCIIAIKRKLCRYFQWR